MKWGKCGNGQGKCGSANIHGEKHINKYQIFFQEYLKVVSTHHNFYRLLKCIFWVRVTIEKQSRVTKIVISIVDVVKCSSSRVGLSALLDLSVP